MATTTSSSTGGGSSSGGGPVTAAPQAALDLVRPMQPLLAGFAHRNKNQHRGASWFASFAMLRRHVDKLADETAAHAARKHRKKPKKKKPPPPPPPRRDEAAAADEEDDGDDDDDDGPAPRRARWLRDVLVPKCYLAFSQLAADNQFATLGVVLLGALAQVQRACVCLVGEGEDSTSGVPAATAAPPASALVPSTAAATTQQRGGGVDDVVDVGEAVSRDDLIGATGDRAPKKRKKPAAGSTPLHAGTVPREAPRPDRKEADGAEGKPAKKKKKAKKGDEFDDLFKSLF